MSGSGLPYRLRPNKYVDRELFAELVARLTAKHGPEHYVYTSMAAHHLTDLWAIYRKAGIEKLYAFDMNEIIVQRQEFNAPVPKTKCGNHLASDLPGKLSEILDEFEAKNAIVWLDFTDFGSRKDQLDDFVQLLRACVAGDVARITLDASEKWLKRLLREQVLREDVQSLPVDGQYAAAFRADVGRFSPPGLSELTVSEIGNRLIEAVAIAARAGTDRTSEPVRFWPVMVAEYADSRNMVTVTLVCTEEDAQNPAPPGWELCSMDGSWTEILRIRAPELSSRERTTIDSHLSDPSKVLEIMPFFDESQIRSYVDLHRFQPNFQNVVP